MTLITIKGNDWIAHIQEDGNMKQLKFSGLAKHFKTNKPYAEKLVEDILDE